MYLYAGQFLSVGRTATALEELFGLPVTARIVLTMTQRAADRLEPFLERVRIEVAAAPVAHFDETGFRAEGRLH